EMQSIVDGSSDSGSHNGLSSVSHLTPAAISDDPDGQDQDVEAPISVDSADATGFASQNSQSAAADETPSSEENSNGESASRSEEHTSELQSRFDLVCRLLLE